MISAWRIIEISFIDAFRIGNVAKKESGNSAASYIYKGICYLFAFLAALASAFFVTSYMIGVAMKIEA